MARHWRKNITYGADPIQDLDLCCPADTVPHKLVVLVHGGGWMQGTKYGANRACGPLADAGFAAASIGYRKVPQTDITGMMGDLAQAVAFLLAHAPKLGIDPRHFAVLGHSSGGHMAALLAADASYLKAAGVDPAKLAAVVALDGVFDVAANITRYPKSIDPAVFGTDPAAWAHVSPVERLAGMQTHPAFCLVHETTESRFVHQSALFEAALRRHGETVTLDAVPGLNHLMLMHLFNDASQPMAAIVTGFLTTAMPL